MARLAGLPAAVVARAREILSGLERDELSRGGRPTLSGATSDVHSSQLGLFAAPADPLDSRGRERLDELAQRLKRLEIDDTTPRQALELLTELKKLADEV